MNEEPKTKLNEAYRTISEVGKMLKLTTSTLRFWEKEFKQIRPHIINKRRYYSIKNIEIIETIKNLVYEKGYTLNGAKKYFENSKITTTNTKTTYTTLKNKIEQLIKLLQDAKTELKNNI